MSDLHKGDKVTSHWGAVQTVEAVSRNGKKLWLMDKEGQLGTFDADKWEKVEPFFGEGKRYISRSSGRGYTVLSVGTSPKGVKYAVMESVHPVGFLVLQQHHFKGFEEV